MKVSEKSKNHFCIINFAKVSCLCGSHLWQSWLLW